MKKIAIPVLCLLALAGVPQMAAADSVLKWTPDLNHSRAEFSTNVKPTDADDFVMTGNLTIKNITKSVKVPVHIMGHIPDDGGTRVGYEEPREPGVSGEGRGRPARRIVRVSVRRRNRGAAGAFTYAAAVGVRPSVCGSAKGR